MRVVRGFIVAGTCAVTLPFPGAARAFEASGWIPYWAQDEASATVQANANLFETGSPFWYSTDAHGKIHAAPGAGSSQVLARLHAANVDVIPTVTAPIGPQQAIDLLGSKASRAKHVRRIVSLAKGYDGIDFDYEHPALTTKAKTAQKVRAALTAFFGQACRALNRHGKQCVVTVMPRTSGSREIWRGRLTPWVYDYEAIARSADTVRVMAYDQHAREYGPGPVGGLPWTKRVIAYSGRTLELHHSELGLPLYGRRWGGGEPGEGLTWEGAQSLRRSCGAKLRWSKWQAESYFRCDSSEVWLADRHSTSVRARLASRAGFAGVAFWTPNGEDPSVWRGLDESGLF